MIEPLISVIIPIYNDEKFLELTINNILNQDYKNLEIICVDDGSTDTTPTILKRLKSKDQRIVILTQQNLGHCVARNNGLKIAKGEYLTFIDHDDQIHPQMISTLYKLISTYNTDISIVSYKIIYNDKIINNFKEKHINNKKIKLYDGTDNILSNALVMEKFGYASWNKLFKMDIVKKMPMFPDVYDPEVGAGEDALFLFKYINFCNNLVYFKSKYYYYRRFKQSLSHQGMSKHSLSQLKVFDYLNQLPKTKYQISQNYIKSYICISSLIMLYRIANSNYSNKEIINFLFNKCFKENIVWTQKCKLQPWYRKYFMWVTKPYIKLKLGNRLTK